MTVASKLRFVRPADRRSTAGAATRDRAVASPAGGRAFRVSWILTALAVPLATVASVAGLLAPAHLYGEPGVAAIIQGQDLVTLLAMPVLVAVVLAARRGSPRAVIVWAGVVSYLLYTYTGAALVYDFNALFPVYVVLFSLSAFALVALLASLDIAALSRTFDGGEPRRAAAGFLLLIAVALGIGELVQVVNAVATGVAPVIAGTDAPLNFVLALDLGVVVPLSALGAALLWRRAPGGYLLAGVLLIKSATMGLALLSMVWFALRAGLPGGELTPLWAIIAAGGLGLSFWFLRHCRT